MSGGARRPSACSAASSSWGSQHNRSLKNVIDDGTNDPFAFELPAFRLEWNDLYLAEGYRPTAVRIACAIGATYTLVTCALNFARDPGLRGEWGGIGWAVRLWGSRGMLAVIMIIIGGAFCVPRLKPFCIRYYNLLCTALLISVYACFVTYYLMYDLRNMFADPVAGMSRVFHRDHLFQYENVTFGFQMTNGWLLMRNCTDANPEAQLMMPFRAMHPPG